MMIDSKDHAVNVDIMSKLAGLDATVTQGFRRLDEKMTRFQSDLHNSQKDTDIRISKLASETVNSFLSKDVKLEHLDCRVTASETWQKVAVAKVSVLVSAVSVLIVLFAPSMRQLLGVPG